MRVNKYLHCLIAFMLGLSSISLSSGYASTIYASSLRSLPAQPRPTPVNPNATQRTRDVLAYLTNQTDNCGVMAGQQTGHGLQSTESYQALIAQLQQETGRWVSFVELDYYDWDRSQDYRAMNTPLLEHWERGGLVGVSWHAPNPWTNGDSWDQSNANLNELLDENSAVHARWIAALDGVAEGLAHLRDAGVVVLWRPLHEMNGNWFWWGMNIHPDDPTPYHRLWQHMFDYFTHTKGLDNLLWVYATTGHVHSSWTRPVDFYYPGDAYVDIVGQDVYNDALDGVNYEELLALGKPFALTEFGPLDARDGSYDMLTMLNQVLARYPRTIYWLSWHDWVENGAQQHISIIRNQNANTLMNHECVTTLDEMAINTATPTPTPIPTPTVTSTPQPTLLQVYKTAQAPIIDGHIDSIWSAASAHRLGNAVVGNSVPTTDLTATFRILYDDEYLYLLLEEVDEAGQHDSGAEWWHDDGTEIYIDGDHSQQSIYDGINDFQFGFRWQDEAIHIPIHSAPAPDGLRFAMRDIVNGDHQEFAIPLLGVGITPQQGVRFGLDVHVNDDDDGGERDTKLAWFATADTSWQDPSTFGTAELVDTIVNSGSDSDSVSQYVFLPAVMR
ncbi:MAG: glycosyl hydrolase [Chloroflexota bacterium]